MMRILHLVRHGSHAEVGHVLSGRSEIALDGRGRAEAAALAARLGGTAVASIHSSPRRRTRETAEALAEGRGLPVHVAAALDEIDFGAFAGRSFASLDRDPEWRRWNAERGSARCPGGETMADAVARAAGYLAAIPADATPALCVSHCDVIRGVVAHLLGLPFDRMFQLGCAPASLTTIAINGDDWRLQSLNLV